MVKIGDIITPQLVGEIVNQVMPPPVIPLTDMGRSNLGKWFEKHGFLRAIAGDADFDRVLDAFNICTHSAKGILFIGGNGVGKTKALNTVWRLLNTDSSDWVDCNDPEQVKWLEMPSTYRNQNVYLDDLGGERFVYQDMDIVGSFICAWHARNPHCKLFATTNLTAKGINERYGGRVLERIIERCVICKFEGKSKREATVV